MSDDVLSASIDEVKYVRQIIRVRDVTVEKTQHAHKPRRICSPPRVHAETRARARADRAYAHSTYIANAHKKGRPQV
eukprot:3461156-Pleurochrysis_carterae.AAC.3